MESSSSLLQTAVYSDSDTGVDADLRRIARLAAACLGVAYAQVIRFAVGDGVVAEPISHGRLFGLEPDLRLACAALPANAEVVVVEDTAKDARIANGLPSEARFFALARLATQAGQPLGALCLLHDSPRTLTTQQTEFLVDFAALASEALIQEEWTGLGAGEALFQSFGEAIFYAMLVTEEGLILHANQQAADLIGIDKPDPLIGREVIDLVPENQIEKVRAQLSVSGHYEVDVVHSSGQTFLAEVQAVTIPMAGRMLRISIIRRAA